MRRGVRAWLVAVLACAGGGTAAAQTGAPAPLSPDDVLRSVAAALPLLERERQQLRAAEGKALEALGAFDLKLGAEAQSVRGFYDNDRAGVKLEQPLSAFGLTAFGGYRTGSGTFAPYDGKAQTLSDGELTAGFALPLARGRATDERRTRRQQADIGVDAAGQNLDAARLRYFRDGLGAYWDWVAAGHQLQIAQALLDIAEARDQQLADAVAAGQVAEVERTDNRRAILQRRSTVVAARRAFEQQGIQLSLYLRGPDGRPVRPGLDRLPQLPRTAASASVNEAASTQGALERRPELGAVRLRRQQQVLQLQLARNSTLPGIELFARSARDYGAGSPNRAGPSFEGGVTFELPFQRRKARGASIEAEAAVSAIDQELRWTEDRIRADVQDALSAIQATQGVVDAVTQEVAVARELEGLERDRFGLGDSTQFLVNLREQATADAAWREARALADYQKALLTLEAATGDLLGRGSQP